MNGDTTGSSTVFFLNRHCHALHDGGGTRPFRNDWRDHENGQRNGGVYGVGTWHIAYDKRDGTTSSGSEGNPRRISDRSDRCSEAHARRATSTVSVMMTGVAAATCACERVAPIPDGLDWTS